MFAAELQQQQQVGFQCLSVLSLTRQKLVVCSRPNLQVHEICGSSGLVKLVSQCTGVLLSCRYDRIFHLPARRTVLSKFAVSTSATER